jgi:ABC-type Mn2+/Zn2+ transport system permease subunit
MMDWILEPLRFGASLRALVEIALIGAVGGAVGCWVVLYRVSYSAESLAHGLLPGLVAATLLGLPTLLGGAAGILAAAVLIALVNRFADGDADTAIAVVVTTLFGIGVLMALSPEAPPGVSGLLFGDLLGVTSTQLFTSALIALAVVATLWLFHDRLLAAGFDPGAGPSLGVSPGLMSGMVLTLVALTVLVGVQGLGNLLVAAVLVTPAAAARLLTERFAPMLALSVAFALAAGIAGIYLSFHARVAAGAAVVACLVVVYLVAAAASAAGFGFGRATSLES